MVRRLIDFSLDNRFLVVALWLLLIAAGIVSLRTLAIDAVPDVTNVQVQVLTNSPGLAPEEVERFITFPVETSMSGLPRVEEIRSTSRFGLSVVTVVFEEGSDIYWARQLVGERLTEAREEIPEGYGEPEMGPISTGLGEIFQFEVRGDPVCPPDGPDTDSCFTPMELRTTLDWIINYQLRSVPGIVEVNSFGGQLKTYQVTIDPGKLVSYGLPLQQVFAALRANNRNVGGGYVTQQGEQFLVRGEGLVNGLDDLRMIVLSHDESGTPVYVRDIARVELAPMIRQGAVTRDGRGEAVVGIVMMLLGENSRTVSQAVKEKIAEIQPSLPKGVRIEPFYDRTELVDRTIHTVATNLLEGGVLVILVLLLLLGNFRAGLIAALSIPLSMLGGFVVMKLTGISGNLMSLGSIDFGLVVDGSVILIENIVRRLHERHDDPEPLVEKVRQAAHEVSRPVVFAVGIITIVFLPILGLQGVEGKMFRPMAATLIYVLSFSLLCTFTIVPALASMLLGKAAEKEPLLFRVMRRRYVPGLGWTLRHRALVVGAAAAIFLVSAAVAPFLGGEFIPRLDEGSIAMQVWRLPSISLEQSNAISTQVEAILKKEFPEVDSVISRTGRAEIATDPMGVEVSDTFVMLKPRNTWRYRSREEMVEAIDETLKRQVPGAIFSYSQPIELRVQELISGVRSDVAVQIYGDDLKVLKERADDVVRVLQKVPGAADVKAEQTQGLPMLRVRIDRQAIARYGINADDVLDVIETVGGKPLGTIVEGQRRFVLQARFDPAVQTLDRVPELRVAAPGGQLVPLSALADVRVEDGPAQISRDRISRRISVEANVRGRDLASFVADAQQAVTRDVKLPPGWTITWGGQFQNLQQATQRLALLLPLAILVVFLLLYMTFNSMRLGTMIFLNVPVAATGGVLALLLRGYPFSISAGVGFIALTGVATMNGLVLVSHIEELRRQGMALAEALRRGAEEKMRAMILAPLVAGLGFLPMAVATSAGAEVQRPLATVVIGGLVTSTLLTLFVLPAIYSWFARREAEVEI
ncbi:MAG: efflux RND transporter permease subunit [Thermoanaerobaculia bacterium]